MHSTFEKYTDNALKAIVLAKAEALRAGCNYLGAEHLLLGLLGAKDGLSFCVLTSIGLELGMVRLEVSRFVPATAWYLATEAKRIGRRPKT
jgi:ATP-dependent Clp protease ATP-binding subunit ClpC